jgi:hypothetical protein
MYLSLLFLSFVVALASAADPLSLHMLVEVPVGGDATIRLQGKDMDGDSLTYKITSLPSSGSLYQLSSVYSQYGYEPKAGVKITSVDTTVTDPKGRVYYERPRVDRENVGEWGRMEYTASDKTGTSKAGTVQLVGPKIHLAASDFSSDTDGWTVTGNRLASSPVNHEASSRGSLNHYIYSTDDTLNVGTTSSDKDLWYFNAPSKFLGYQGLSYNGYIEFTLSSFSGDFSADNLNDDTKLVELFCSSCKVNTGITIAYPLSSTSFNGSTKTFKIPLLETAGWLQDPENTLAHLHPWNPPTRCQFIEVLSSISSLKILGDYTKWYESVSVDNVVIGKDKAASSIPICAQRTPDASSCDC